MTTTTTYSNATTCRITSYQIVEKTYRDFPWFDDVSKLIENVTLGWHHCEHEPLPSRGDRDAWSDFDDYFIEEARLEAKGWRSFSIGSFSKYEYDCICEFVARYGKKRAHMSQLTPSHDLFPIIGPVESPCFVITMHSSLIEETSDFLDSFYRPCMVVTHQDTKEIKGLLPPNHRILVGPDATCVSYDLVDKEAHEAILALHEPKAG